MVFQSLWEQGNTVHHNQLCIYICWPLKSLICLWCCLMFLLSCVTSPDSFPDLPVGQNTQSRQNVCWQVSCSNPGAARGIVGHPPFSPIIGCLDLAVGQLVVFLGTLSELLSLKYWLLSSSGRLILVGAIPSCNNCSNQSWISGPTAYCHSCGWSWNKQKYIYIYIHNLHKYQIFHGHEQAKHTLYNRSPYISI